MHFFDTCGGNGRKINLKNFDSEVILTYSGVTKSYVEGISYTIQDRNIHLDNLEIEEYIKPDSEKIYIVSVYGLSKLCNEDEMHDSVMTFLNWCNIEELAEEFEIVF